MLGSQWSCMADARPDMPMCPVTTVNSLRLHWAAAPLVVTMSQRGWKRSFVALLVVIAALTLLWIYKIKWIEVLQSWRTFSKILLSIHNFLRFLGLLLATSDLGNEISFRTVSVICVYTDSETVSQTRSCWNESITTLQICWLNVKMKSSTVFGLKGENSGS